MHLSDVGSVVPLAMFDSHVWFATQRMTHSVQVLFVANPTLSLSCYQMCHDRSRYHFWMTTQASISCALNRFPTRMIVNRDTLHPSIKLPQNTSRSLPQCLRSSARSVHWFAAGLRRGHCYAGCVIQVERSAPVAVALTRRAQVLEDISNSLFCSVMVLSQGIIATGEHCCDIRGTQSYLS